MQKTTKPKSRLSQAPLLGRTLERALFKGPVAGIDEVGRGALAGPVVVAAAVLGETYPEGLRDSKLLSPLRREQLVEELQAMDAVWTLGFTEASRIDEIGIVPALREAAQTALRGLDFTPKGVLLDGPHNYIQGDWNVQTVVRGDQAEACIAAASVVAKVARDAIMRERDSIFPGYGFASHVGYGTVAHREAIRTLGPCVEHRRSWRLLPNL